jgi:hypothetical protein
MEDDVEPESCKSEEVAVKEGVEEAALIVDDEVDREAAGQQLDGARSKLERSRFLESMVMAGCGD